MVRQSPYGQLHGAGGAFFDAMLDRILLDSSPEACGTFSAPAAQARFWAGSKVDRRCRDEELEFHGLLSFGRDGTYKTGNEGPASRRDRRCGSARGRPKRPTSSRERQGERLAVLGAALQGNSREKNGEAAPPRALTPDGSAEQPTSCRSASPVMPVCDAKTAPIDLSWPSDSDTELQPARTCSSDSSDAGDVPPYGWHQVVARGHRRCRGRLGSGAPPPTPQKVRLQLKGVASQRVAFGRPGNLTWASSSGVGRPSTHHTLVTADGPFVEFAIA